MDSQHSPGSRPSRVSGDGEPGAERLIWERYWDLLASHGVKAGQEGWYERWCLRFIRELKPRRLRQATAEDVGQFLGLQALQSDGAGWKVRQADHALRILLRDLVRVPELDGWMELGQGDGFAIKSRHHTASILNPVPSPSNRKGQRAPVKSLSSQPRRLW